MEVYYRGNVLFGVTSFMHILWQMTYIKGTTEMPEHEDADRHSRIQRVTLIVFKTTF